MLCNVRSRVKKGKKKRIPPRAMKTNGSAVFLLFLALSLALCAESERGTKKRGDLAQKSNSNEETEEEVAAEDMESAFEQLRELSALRDTILKLVPATDPIYEKISKQGGGKDAESKTESPSKETLESPGTRSVWMKTMIAETKDTESVLLSGRQLDDEDMESWENQELFEMLEEEIQEPLSAEQQAGEAHFFKPSTLLTFDRDISQSLCHIVTK